MDKEKEIEEMAKELHCATNESFISCRKIARILVERRGYGNTKQTVRELGEKLNQRVQVLKGDGFDEYNEGFARGVRETLYLINELLAEVIGE